MFRLPLRLLIPSATTVAGSATQPRFFDASADAVDNSVDVEAPAALGAKKVNSSWRINDVEAEERRRLKILSRDLGQQAAKIFDRVTTTLEEFEDIDRRTAQAASATTQRLAFDESTVTSLTALLENAISDTTGQDAGRARPDPEAAPRCHEKLDARALKSSLNRLEHEYIGGFSRRAKQIYDLQRMDVSREKVREIKAELKGAKRNQRRSDPSISNPASKRHEHRDVWQTAGEKSARDDSGSVRL